MLQRLKISEILIQKLDALSSAKYSGLKGLAPCSRLLGSTVLTIPQSQIVDRLALLRFPVTTQTGTAMLHKLQRTLCFILSLWIPVLSLEDPPRIAYSGSQFSNCFCYDLSSPIRLRIYYVLRGTVEPRRHI